MNSKKLVSVFAKEETMNSYEFWKVLNNFREELGASHVQHNHFLARVVDELDDLPDVKVLQLKRPQGGTNEMQSYDLNKDQMLLIGMRESKRVRKQVLKWLHELSDRVNELEQQKINRANSSLNYIKQNDMLKQVRDAEGKQTPSHIYSNNANLLNRIVLGMTAVKYRQYNELLATDNLRDTLTTVQLECIAKLDVYNTSFIAASIDYDTRKTMLTKIFMRDFNCRIIDEMIKLEA